MLKDHNDKWTENDGAKCAACGDTHWERARGGDFAEYCGECESRTAVCGQRVGRGESREVGGVVFCVIQYGKHKGELCECAGE